MTDTNTYYHRHEKPKDRIFVFGSNLAGRHGLGAALTAFKLYKAKYGKGVGHYGNSYAIPTKDESLVVLSLRIIVPYIHEFVQYTQETNYDFFVTAVGCGLAHYKPEDIAPHFKGSVRCRFPESFREYLTS